MNCVKVGIAGFGVVVKRRKDCVDRHPRMRVVAVCDRPFDGEGAVI
jgi:glyceraldehyde-3-phosphate dehydrogenase/erythrose-4-phosphate dehydrogenase